MVNRVLRRFLLLALAAAGLAATAAPRTIYVARHGQVGDKTRYDAQIGEPTLTALGEEQAQLLGKYLTRKCGFAGAIVVSPFCRTIQTALPVAAALKTKVLLEPGVQEVAPQAEPAPRGMTLAEIEERFPGRTRPGKTFADNWRLCREDFAARERRVGAALDRVLAEIPEGDILIVTHGGPINSLVRALNARRADGVKSIRNLPWNCCLFVFELDAAGKVAKSRFTTEYLPDTKCTDNMRRTKLDDKKPGKQAKKVKP